MEKLDDLIGTILGTRTAPAETAAAQAHQRGFGFDPRRSRTATAASPGC